MDLLDQGEFARRLARLQRVGRISGQTAKGYAHDLDLAISNAGVETFELRWRGDDDCSFTVRARFFRTTSDGLQRLLRSLERDAVFDGETFACVHEEAGDRLALAFATSDENLGFVTVCVDLGGTSPDKAEVTSRLITGDIREHFRHPGRLPCLP